LKPLLILQSFIHRMPETFVILGTAPAFISLLSIVVGLASSSSGALVVALASGFIAVPLSLLAGVVLVCVSLLRRSLPRTLQAACALSLAYEIVFLRLVTIIA